MKNRKPFTSSEADVLLEIKNLLHKIFELVTHKKSGVEGYYDNADVKQILKTSDSTLHRWRKSNKIPFKKIQGKIYYPTSFFNKAFD